MVDELEQTWRNMPFWARMVGLVVFIYATYKTAPVIGMILQICVLIVGLILMLATMGCSEEVANQIGEFWKQAKSACMEKKDDQ